MRRFLEALVVVSGIVLAGYVLVTVVAGEPAPTTDEEELSLPTTTQVDTRVAPPTTAAEIVEVVELPPPPPEVDELPASVSAVLADNGHTSIVPRSELAGQLPDSVTAVLIDAEVVLTLTETDSSAGAETDSSAGAETAP